MSEDYWTRQEEMRELYARAVEDPHVSWHYEYLKEREKRIAIEEKYERLTRKIKENAVKEVSEREVGEFGKLHYVDFGGGDREVQHIMKKEEI